MAYWKDLEKEIAKLVGGDRVSQPYANLPDVLARKVVVECKARKALPQWIQGALDQARSFTRPDQLGIAVLHQKGRHHKNDLVVMALEDFLAWFRDNLEVDKPF